MEFSRMAQTKYPDSVTAIQERHLDAAMQFSPLVSFTSTADDVRWPGLESTTAASRNCEWGGGRRNTHNKLGVHCTDVALVRLGSGYI